MKYENHGNRKVYNVGEIYNGITLVKEMNVGIGNRRRAIFKCHCGKEWEADMFSISSGHSKSCGCLIKKSSKKRFTTHGLSNTKYIKVWNRIKQRCYDKNSPSYKNYGGRGIFLAEYWINDPISFINYIKVLKNSSKEGYSLDRINNDGNYEKGNLRYSTAKQQANNRRVRTFKPHWNKHRSRWVVRCMKKGVRYYLGSFKNKSEAQKTVDDFLKLIR